jgi:hypothetical protein
MALPADIPLSSRLAIAQLARQLPAGVTPESLEAALIRWVLVDLDRDAQVWVFLRGLMLLQDYLDRLHNLYNARVKRLTPGDRPGFAEWTDPYIANEIMLGADNVAHIAADYGFPLPPWHEAWAARQEHESDPAAGPGGRPSRREESRAAWQHKLTDEERQLRGSSLRWAIRWALHPELKNNKNPRGTVPEGLSDRAIDRHLRGLY